MESGANIGWTGELIARLTLTSITLFWDPRGSAKAKKKKKKIIIIKKINRVPNYIQLQVERR